jgi:hypothetical protein
LTIIDARPGDPFDFDLAHYKRQLAAGTAKVTVDNGLVVRMPDFGRVARR